MSKEQLVIQVGECIKAGDRLPALELLLQDTNGNPIDLSDFDYRKIVIAPCVDGRRIVDLGSLAFKTDGTNGLLVYSWADGETDKAGEYLVEVVLSTVASPSDSDPVMTLPGGSYGKLTISPRL